MKTALTCLSAAYAALAGSAAAGCMPGYEMVKKDGQQLCQSAFVITADVNLRTGSVVATSSHMQRLPVQTRAQTASNQPTE